MTTLTSADHCTENVRIGAAIIAELKFSDVQGKILVADLVERANNAAFKDATKNLQSYSCARRRSTYWPRWWSTDACGYSLSKRR